MNELMDESMDESMNGSMDESINKFPLFIFGLIASNEQRIEKNVWMRGLAVTIPTPAPQLQ